MVEFQQADIEAANSYLSPAKERTVDGLIQAFARHRQAGVQQGLDMAAAYIQTEYPFDKRKLVPAIRKLGGGDA